MAELLSGPEPSTLRESLLDSQAPPLLMVFAGPPADTWQGMLNNTPWRWETGMLSFVAICSRGCYPYE